MKIQDYVKVKRGSIYLPGKQFNINDWEGQIIDLDLDEALVQWDEETITNRMSRDFITKCINDKRDFKQAVLETRLLEVVEKKTNRNFQIRSGQYDDIFTKQGRLKRLSLIFESEDITVNEKNMIRYHDYLSKNLNSKFIFTGRKIFSWEIPYMDGTWCKSEYDIIRKTKAAHIDFFTFESVHDYISSSGIKVNAIRIHDGSNFILPLFDLKSIENQMPAHNIISDYIFWLNNLVMPAD